MNKCIINGLFWLSRLRGHTARQKRRDEGGGMDKNEGGRGGNKKQTHGPTHHRLGFTGEDHCPADPEVRGGRGHSGPRCG